MKRILKRIFTEGFGEFFFTFGSIGVGLWLIYEVYIQGREVEVPYAGFIVLSLGLFFFWSNYIREDLK